MKRSPKFLLLMREEGSFLLSAPGGSIRPMTGNNPENELKMRCAMKKLLTNLFAISLATFFASSAMAAGNIHYFSEYLGRDTTPQEAANIIAADRETQGLPVVISTAGSNELKYSSEYMGGNTTRSLEARTEKMDREAMAKPAVITNTGRTCFAKLYSEYDSAYKCL
jgi:hypothetical protein